MRTGFLSDESIMTMCAEYNPIPLGKASAILSPKPHGKTPLAKSPIETRRPKYVQPPHRPATFGALANSIAKQQNPTNPLPIQRQMNEMYEKELGQINVAPNNNAMLNHGDRADDNNDADLIDMTNDLFQEMDAERNTPPQSPPMRSDAPTPRHQPQHALTPQLHQPQQFNTFRATRSNQYAIQQIL